MIACWWLLWLFFVKTESISVFYLMEMPDVFRISSWRFICATNSLVTGNSSRNCIKFTKNSVKRKVQHFIVTCNWTWTLNTCVVSRVGLTSSSSTSCRNSRLVCCIWRLASVHICTSKLEFKMQISDVGCLCASTITAKGSRTKCYSWMVQLWDERTAALLVSTESRPSQIMYIMPQQARNQNNDWFSIHTQIWLFAFWPHRTWLRFDSLLIRSYDRELHFTAPHTHTQTHTQTAHSVGFFIECLLCDVVHFAVDLLHSPLANMNKHIALGQSSHVNNNKKWLRNFIRNSWVLTEWHSLLGSFIVSRKSCVCRLWSATCCTLQSLYDFCIHFYFVQCPARWREEPTRRWNKKKMWDLVRSHSIDAVRRMTP